MRGASEYLSNEPVDLMLSDIPPPSLFLMYLPRVWLGAHPSRRNTDSHLRKRHARQSLARPPGSEKPSPRSSYAKVTSSSPPSAHPPFSPLSLSSTLLPNSFSSPSTSSVPLISPPPSPAPKKSLDDSTSCLTMPGTGCWARSRPPQTSTHAHYST